MKARLWGAEAQCVQWIVLLFNNMPIVQLTKHIFKETFNPHKQFWKLWVMTITWSSTFIQYVCTIVKTVVYPSQPLRDIVHPKIKILKNKRRYFEELFVRIIKLNDAKQLTFIAWTKKIHYSTYILCTSEEKKVIQVWVNYDKLHFWLNYAFKY